MNTEKKNAIFSYVGFTCCMCFFFSLFNGVDESFVTPQSYSMDFVEQLGLLILMMCAFALVRVTNTAKRMVLLEGPVTLLFVALSFVLTLSVKFLGSEFPALELVNSACCGLASAFLICSWFSRLGPDGLGSFAPKLFICAGTGAFFCIVFCAIPSVPLASLFALASGFCLTFYHANNEQLEFTEAENTSSSAVKILSSRIRYGTVLFGVCAGLVQSYLFSVGDASDYTNLYALVFFVLFCIGASQLHSLAPGSDKPNTGATSVQTDEKQDKAHMWRFALCYSYRIAICLFLAGLFLIPVLDSSAISGVSIAQAGYFALLIVVSSLFVMISYVLRVPFSMSVSEGLSMLFAGQVLGLLAANVFIYVANQNELGIVVIAFAGVLSIFTYSFLFTHQDFAELSAVASAEDNFEEACLNMSGNFGLSNREAEVLPLALKGRTAERISQELVISKSTVDTHLRRIYAKCGVHNRQELIDLGEAYALELSTSNSIL